MRFFICALFLYTSNVLAFEPHTATYQLSINDFQIAEEARTLRKTDQRYTYTARAETSGFAAMIKDYAIVASSNFVINQTGVDSVNYKITEKEDGEVSKNYVIDMDSNNQIVTSVSTKQRPDVVTWKTKSGNIIDPLSLFLALSNDLEVYPRRTQFTYQVADGKSIETYRFEKVSSRVIKIDDESFHAIQVDRVGKKDSTLQAYFLTGHQYIPAIIKKIKDSKEYIYKIKDFEF